MPKWEVVFARALSVIPANVGRRKQMDAQVLSDGLRENMYRKMVLIRKFEEKLVEFAQVEGRLVGMQILANGQEAVAVGIIEALRPADVIVSNHRSHGHLLARGVDAQRLMAEIMGKAAGVNKGKAGTLHLAAPEVNALMTTTVVGAGPPMAVGAAFAQQYRNAPNLTVSFFGDGAAAEGSVHEAMNLAALWKLPILFVCENNCWAGAQGLKEHCPVDNLSQRAGAYGIPGQYVDGNDVEALYRATAKMAAACRQGKGPGFIEARTYRMRGHGEGDHQHYVDKKELEMWSRLCPIKRLKDRLLADGLITEAQILAIDSEMETTVADAVQFADNSPYPLPEEALEDVWVEGATI